MTETSENKSEKAPEDLSRTESVQDNQGEVHNPADHAQRNVTIKSQVEFIRKAREERAVIEAQRDEAQMQKRIAENRLDAVSILATAGVVNPNDACVLLEQQLDFSDTTPEQLQQGTQELLMNKSYLLAPSNSTKGTMPTITSNLRDTNSGQSLQLAAVAERAARSGNRRDIAEYLRLRRQLTRN